MKSKYIKLRCRKCNKMLLRGEKPIYYQTHRVCNDCSGGIRWQEKMKNRNKTRKMRRINEKLISKSL